MALSGSYSPINVQAVNSSLTKQLFVTPKTPIGTVGPKMQRDLEHFFLL